MVRFPVPELKWEWKVWPSTILAAVQLVAIIVAVAVGFTKMQYDNESQKVTNGKFEILISSMRDAQMSQSERITRVETKMDIIIPSIQRIEARQIGRDQQGPR